MKGKLLYNLKNGLGLEMCYFKKVYKLYLDFAWTSLGAFLYAGVQNVPSMAVLFYRQETEKS